MQRIRFDADVVFGGFGTPIDGGSVVVQVAPTGSTVLFVGSRSLATERFPAAHPVAAGPVVAPAPVNAHVHLDLSTMPTFEGPYVSFVQAVMAHGRTGARNVEAARLGVDELVRAGTTTVGDVVASVEVMEALLAEPRLTGVAYWEVIGPDPTDAEAVFDAARASVVRFLEAQRPGGVRVGLSPHAPHTVSAPAMTRLVSWAKEVGLPVQIHVAESAEEAQLHRHGTGPLRAFMGPFLGAFRASGLSPVGYLDALGVLGPHVTLVHAVEVDDADVAAIQRAGSTVVHCPRSNEALQGGRFPWATYARHGCDVALGTDSRGSSPDLDVRAELDAAARVHGREAPPRALVRAAVKGGHRALGTESPRVVRGSDAGSVVAWRLPGSFGPVPLDVAARSSFHV